MINCQSSYGTLAWTDARQRSGGEVLPAWPGGAVACHGSATPVTRMRIHRRHTGNRGRDDSECPVLNGFSQANVYHDGELPGSALLHERPKHLHYGDNGHHRGWTLNGELTPMHTAQGTREIGASQQHLPPGLAGRCTAVNTH
eukprot:COSAG06_NODE_1964_length_7968_cov_4.231033_1_plen_143_part_00